MGIEWPRPLGVTMAMIPQLLSPHVADIGPAREYQSIDWLRVITVVNEPSGPLVAS